MISYNEFINFNKTNYNFSVCDDWGWFHIDEENLLEDPIVYLHYKSPPIKTPDHPYKSILKKRHNPHIQSPLNIVQKMPHAHLTIDNVYLPVSHSPSYNNSLRSSFNCIKKGILFSVLLVMYIYLP